MKNWEPNNKERKYLVLVMSMTTDCILGRGTVDRETYVGNLERIAKQLGELPKDLQD